ncbi:MAG: protein kinase [Myxococcota bacterium]
MDLAFSENDSWRDDSSTLLALLRNAAAFSDVVPADQEPGLVEGDELANGRFVIESLVGRGGMGCVYAAFDRKLETRVAIKTLRKIAPQRLALFKREFRALADVRHPGLVRPGELVEDVRQLFFTMELVEGVGVREYLKRQPAQLESVILQLTDVLSWMHDRGLVHCDVKPANMLVTRGGRVVLLDFGVAQRLRGFEATANEGFGTPAYMAPEQFEGVALTGACDFYALGVMLFEHFTGQLPFEGTRSELRQQKVLARRPRTLAPQTSQTMDDLVYGLLAPRPGDRPNAQALRELLGGSLGPQWDVESTDPEEFFVGRTRELDLLGDALASVENGATVAVNIRGPSGIGKSALVRKFLRGVDSRALVLVGRCYERESLAFKGIESVMDAVAEALLALPPDIQRGLRSDVRTVVRAFPSMASTLNVKPDSRPADRVELMAAVDRLFRALTDATPIVLFVDDLHWADGDGLVVLRTLFAERPDGRRLLLTTSRSSQWDLPTVPVHSVELRPLTPIDVRHLVADLGHKKPLQTPDLMWLVEQAQGHPMLVTELLRAKRSTGCESVEQLLRQRIARLSIPARELLEILVVVGAPLERAVLQDAAGLGPAAFDRWLEELFMHTLVFSEGLSGAHKVEPSHDSVRETLSRMLSTFRVRRVHEEVLRTLHSRGIHDDERLAVHYRGLGDNARGYVHTVAAAHKAVEAGAFGHGADLFAIAVKLAPIEKVTELRLWRASALRRAWRSIEAAEELLAVAETSSEAAAQRYRREAGELLLIGGELERGLRTVEPDLRRLGALPPKRMSVAMATTPLVKLRYAFLERLPSRLLRASRRVGSEDIDFLWRVGSAFTTIDPIRSLHLQTAGRILALLQGDRLQIARGCGLEACMQAGAGSPQKAEVLVNRAEQVLADALVDGEDPERVERVRQMVAGGTMVLALHHGRWESGFVAARDGHTEGRAWRNNWQHALRGLYLLHYEFHRGRYRRFLERLDDDLSDARARNDVYLRLAMQVWPEPVAALMADQPDKAEQVIQRATDTLLEGRHGGYFDALRVVASMMTALYRGDPAHSLSLLDGKDMAARVLFQASHYGRVHLRFFEAMSRMHDRHRFSVRLRIRTMAERLERDSVPWAKIYAAFLRAQLATRPVVRVRELTKAQQMCVRFEQKGLLGIVALAEAEGPKRERATQELLAHGVVSPTRFARLFLGDLVPGTALGQSKPSA